MSLDGKKISELARVTSVRDDSLLVVDNGGTEANSVYVEDLLKKAGTDKQDKLTAGDNIKIENNVISANVISDRNIGEIVQSVLPLTDAGLHLLDGTLLDGNGIYGEFVDYIAALYNENPNASCFAQTTDVSKYNIFLTGSTTFNKVNGVVDGFSANSYATTPILPQTQTANSWEFVFAVNMRSFPSAQVLIGNDTDNYNGGGFVLRTTSSNGNLYCWMTSNGTGWDIMSQFSTGITLTLDVNYVKIEFTGSEYNFYSSADGLTWTKSSNVITSTSKMFNFTSNPRFGVSSTSNYPLTQGALLLDKCYIKINGDFVWQGKEVTTYNPSQYWDYCVSTYGSCGKFVYNSSENTVRLPKIECILEGTSTTNNLGNLIEAGLPNIVGDVGYGITDDIAYVITGPFYRRITAQYKLTWASGTTSYPEISFDASRSNLIYGNSDTVQPQTIKVLVYMVIASSSKKTIGMNDEQAMSKLDFKAEDDLSNVVKPNQNFIQQSVLWGIPDYSNCTAISYQQLQNWVAPTSGVLFGRIDWDNTGGWIYVNGNPVIGGMSDISSVNLPLTKGDTITYVHFDTNNTNQFYFYPFKGL